MERTSLILQFHNLLLRIILTLQIIHKIDFKILIKL